jgi:hypothetical protein
MSIIVTLPEDDSQGEIDSTNISVSHSEPAVEPNSATRGVSMSYIQLKQAVDLLCSKRRHEYPTTMYKEAKKSAIKNDITLLSTSYSLCFNERQYIAFAKKVEQAAYLFQKDFNATIDLKTMFGFPRKQYGEADSEGNNYIRHRLYQLGCELIRAPNPQDNELNHREIMDAQAAAKNAKNSVGKSTIIVSTTGKGSCPIIKTETSTKRAKVSRGGSNLTALPPATVSVEPLPSRELGSIESLANEAATLVEYLKSANLPVAASTHQPTSIIASDAFSTFSASSSSAPVASTSSAHYLTQASSVIGSSLNKQSHEITQSTFVKTCFNCEAKSGSQVVVCWRCSMPM